MKRFTILLVLISGSLFFIESFSQTAASRFKSVSIGRSGVEVEEISASLRFAGLKFADSNNLSQLNAGESGTFSFYICNAGINDITSVVVGISELNNIRGLQFERTTTIESVKAGDSVQVSVPVSAGNDLTEGFALLSVSVGDKVTTLFREVHITVPTKQAFSAPLFSWSNPDSVLKRTDFPMFEIAGVLKSRTRITGMDLYLNGMVPADRNTFTILPTENPDEYQIRRIIALDEGYNEIRVEASNEVGKVASDSRVVNYAVRKIDNTYSEKRIALVIGNADYIHGNKLSNPVNDARDFSAALKELGFNVLTFINADLKTMKMAMDEFGENLGNYNIGLFYFAGHGLQVKGDNYLIPIDANLRVEQDVDYDCINVGRVLGKMEAAGTSTNIIILDACRDNPFERSWSARSGARGGGLAFMNAPSGSIISYATSPGKTASDGTGKNGLYTEALLQYINVPGLPIEEFFKNVRRTVEIRSNRAQTPWESTSLKGNFFFKVK